MNETNDTTTPASQLVATVLAVDPGREKCGVVILRRAATGQEAEAARLFQKVVARADLDETVRHLLAQHGVTIVIVGDATSGRDVVAQLRTLVPADVAVEAVPEQNTTQQARRRYWQENPPRGFFRRLLPTTLQTPPRPWDDYAALLLAENYKNKVTDFLEQNEGGKCQSSDDKN